MWRWLGVQLVLALLSVGIMDSEQGTIRSKYGSFTKKKKK